MNLEFNPCSIMLASCKCYGRSKRGKLTRNKYRSLQRYVNAVKFYIAFVTFDFTVRRVEFNELFRLCNRQQSCLTLSTDFYLAFNARQLKHKISTRDIKVKKKRERKREREHFVIQWITRASICIFYEISFEFLEKCLTKFWTKIINWSLVKYRRSR